MVDVVVMLSTMIDRLTALAQFLSLSLSPKFMTYTSSLSS